MDKAWLRDVVAAARKGGMEITPAEERKLFAEIWPDEFDGSLNAPTLRSVLLGGGHTNLDPADLKVLKPLANEPWVTDEALVQSTMAILDARKHRATDAS
jgi:hypothetical protein